MSPDRDARIHAGQVGYDPVTETYHAHHDWERQSSLCYTILSTVSALVGEEPLALEPISKVVDTDALNNLFRGSRRSGRPSDRVRFSIEGCDVIVHRNGHIVVDPREYC